MTNTFKTLSTLTVGGETIDYYSLPALEAQFPHVARLPFSLKILLENLLRREDGAFVKADDIRALAGWTSGWRAEKEISFMPARVLLQDFTGVPCVVDLAAMRDGIVALGGDPEKVNPLQPVELVIDHSVQVDHFGAANSFQLNADLEYHRNRERYVFLRWGQTAFRNFRVVPPETGIVHQVNIEYLARVVCRDPQNGRTLAYPDTVFGTDSHTTMVNGLGVVGWGVGGIEAEAAMLGQPSSMLIPPVVGYRLKGRLPEGATATDLVLTITEALRKKGVVGKFVEFYGPGLAHLTISDRVTLGNMCPEYGATVAIFPIDDMTLDYLRLTSRDASAGRAGRGLCARAGPVPHRRDARRRVRRHAGARPGVGRAQPRGSAPAPGSRRVEQRQGVVCLGAAGPAEGREEGRRLRRRHGGRHRDAARARVRRDCRHHELHQHVEPERDDRRGPGGQEGGGEGPHQQAVGEDQPGARIEGRHRVPRQGRPETYLDQLGFNLVGYGCTTCIGNSGPLPDEISAEVRERGLVVASVLSGNRNFEGRIQQEVRANYLASPPLVVAYALAGSMNVDVATDSLGTGKDGKPVYLKDIWPTEREVQQAVLSAVTSEMFKEQYASVFEGDERWQQLPVPTGDNFAWEADSTYIRKPPFLENLTREPKPLVDITGARALAVLGDSITTDHISPAGSIKADSPAGKYLIANGVEPKEFNSYGARRGNHEVMMRGTFANVRLRNQLAPGTEGGWTTYLPGDEVMSIYDASMKYQDAGVPLVILAGKEYGSGSSRDWAAKGTMLLGVKAVVAESFERIHRSNLVNMGVLPLQFLPGESASTHGLTGREVFALVGAGAALKPRGTVTVKATAEDGSVKSFTANVRIDTPEELVAYGHGGILPYVLRQLTRQG